MPIEYQRDDRRRLITVTLTEPYSFEELLNQTDRQWAEHTWAYAILYDSRTIAHIPPASELQQLVDRRQVVGGEHARGPVGVAILPRPEMVRGLLQFATRSRPRDLEVLLTDAQLEAWLTRNAPRRESPDPS
jgi:hypothetical protein